MGPELFWELFFSVLGFLFGSAVLSVFLAICSILELEAAISTALQHLEFEPLIFHDICSILALKLFMLDGIL